MSPALPAGSALGRALQLMAGSRLLRSHNEIICTDIKKAPLVEAGLFLNLKKRN